MENYLHDRKIKRTPEFQQWFENYFKSQFKYGEGLLTVLCWRALKAGQMENCGNMTKLLPIQLWHWRRAMVKS